MTAGREASAPNLADHLSAANSLAGPDHIARGVVEGGLHTHAVDAAMAKKQPVAVCRAEVGAGDNSRVRRTYRGTASSAEVSPVMQLPNLE